MDKNSLKNHAFKDYCEFLLCARHYTRGDENDFNEFIVRKLIFLFEILLAILKFLLSYIHIVTKTTFSTVLV